jgi:cellulose synthase/poly-beta-1,6-N-acetylglucosamine synthase-like glycosyltransferase
LAWWLGTGTEQTEVPLSSLIRQTHRWLSIVFTMGVVTNLVVYSLAGKGHQPAFWWNLLVLIPVFLLLLSGLYLFALPYFAGWKRAVA